MFGFGKKDNTSDSDGSSKELLVTKPARYVCDLNMFAGQTCALHFEKPGIRFVFEETERYIEYSRIVSCGKIKNTKSDIRKAMDTRVLSQAVMSSSGFLAGGFYTLENIAKEFLFIKFKDSKNDQVIHTFLLVYNSGVDRAISIIRKYAAK